MSSRGEPGAELVKAGYDAVYQATVGSDTFRRIWEREAAGGAFPDGFEHISFLTLPELESVAEHLRLGPHATLVDLACGAGGPGLWLAASAGASLVGVDLSTVGLSQAGARAERAGLTASARFVEGSFASTTLADGVADGIVSFDALQYAPDKAAAFVEAERILHPRGHLVLTAFEVDPNRVRGVPILEDDPVPDFGPVLARAGFVVECYEETPGWHDRVRRTYEAILRADVALLGELGEPAHSILAGEVRTTLERDFYLRRVLVVASLAPRA